MAYSTVGVRFTARNDAGRGVRSFDRELTRLGRTARTVGSAFGLYLGVHTLGRTLVGFKNAARDAAESENLFSVALGRNEKAARSWSQQYSRALHLNQYETRRTVATFYVMLDSMGLIQSDALKMSQALTGLANDMASFYNLRTEEAFAKLQAGITGEIEPLKRLGIVINETQVKNYALSQGWIKQGEALTETQKIYARFNLIAEQTRTAQGDMIRTSDQLANVERQNQAVWQEISVTLGQSFTPAVNTASKAMRDWLVENRRDISRWADDFVEGVGIAIEAMGRLNTADTSFRERYDRLSRNEQELFNREYERRTGQNVGYRNVGVGGSMGGVTGTRRTYIGPSNSRVAREMMAVYDRVHARNQQDPVSDLRDRVAGLGQVEALGPPGGDGGSATAAMSTAGRSRTTDMLQAYRAIASDMGRTNRRSWYVQSRALWMQRQKLIEEMGGTSKLIDTWYAEQQEKLGIERGKAVGGLFGGMRAGVAEMNRELMTTGEIFADLTRQARDGFVGAINDAIFRSEDLGASLRRVALSMVEYGLTENVLKPAVTSVFGSFLGGLAGGAGANAYAAHERGGVFGRGGVKMFARGGVVSSPSTFNYGNNVGAIAEKKSEGIFPLAMGRDGLGVTGPAPSVSVNVINNGQPMSARVIGEQFNAALNEAVVTLVLDDLNTGGPISRRTGLS